MASRFKKISRIGRGTFGEAWLVASSCSGRKYVIKEVRVDEMSEEELEKTRTEATILARCKHNSIIRYKEYFMLPDPATMCLVMEYADGGDLAEKIKTAKQNGMTIPESTILHWFIQVIFAVQYLHTNNILHRDLKTQNIFLTKTNLVKVGDFGIARFLRDKQDLATTAIGTPYYLSPEICQRKPYNHKSDMWAVGCILYELCALRHPFDAENFEDLVIKILKGAFQPLPSSFSSLLKDLISVMLRTNPERRPTADALLMLPSLKPYVENYLMQYEELINKRDKTSYADDNHPLKSKLTNSKDESPVKDLPNNLKVHDLDKGKSASENSVHEDIADIQLVKKLEINIVLPQLASPVVTPNKHHHLDSLSDSLEGNLFHTVSKNMDLRQVDCYPLSSPNSPKCKCSSSSSPIHPPAPPNTPINKHFSNTPPDMNILSVYLPLSSSSSPELSQMSLVKSKSTGRDCCRTSYYAPTPCNTPTRVACNVSLCQTNSSRRSFSQSSSPSPLVLTPVPARMLNSYSVSLHDQEHMANECEVKVPSKNLVFRNNECELEVLSKDQVNRNNKFEVDVPGKDEVNGTNDEYEINIPSKNQLYRNNEHEVEVPSKDQVNNNNECEVPEKESRNNYIHPNRKCKECGRGFSDTYVIGKTELSENSAQSVFEL